MGAINKRKERFSFRSGHLILEGRKGKKIYDTIASAFFGNGEGLSDRWPHLCSIENSRLVDSDYVSGKE